MFRGKSSTKHAGEEGRCRLLPATASRCGAEKAKAASATGPEGVNLKDTAELSNPGLDLVVREHCRSAWPGPAGRPPHDGCTTGLDGRLSLRSKIASYITQLCTEKVFTSFW